MLLSSILLLTVIYFPSYDATIAQAEANAVSHAKKNELKMINVAHAPKKNLSYFHNNEMETKTTVLAFVKHINTYKRKGGKKLPKRTIQKIIKKSKKNKINKMLLVTSPRTEPSIIYDVAKYTTTTQAALKKKTKKWNSKLTRYPLPFHKLNARKDINIHHKIKRETNDLEDSFILKDLDYIEFLSHEDETNAIKAHVVKSW